MRHLPQILGHAGRARWIMLQNVGLSLLIIGALIPLAAAGVLGLATVVFIHELAEVIANAVRAARTVPLPPASTPVTSLPKPRLALTLHAVNPPGGTDACGCEPGRGCCQPAAAESPGKLTAT